MKNPYVIKPRQILFVKEILERFLDWDDWNYLHERAALGNRCLADLHGPRLCCSDHLAMRAECDAFFRYLFHMTGSLLVKDQTGFSARTLKDFIRAYARDASKRKAARYMGLTTKEWREYMEG